MSSHILDSLFVKKNDNFKIIKKNCKLYYDFIILFKKKIKLYLTKGNAEIIGGRRLSANIPDCISGATPGVAHPILTGPSRSHSIQSPTEYYSM